MSELGNRLREAREAKGLSLDELQALTKIQKRYLLGIEEGNYEMMPGKFYVRAFIKQYAEAVNLNQNELFEQYKNEIPTTYTEEIPKELSRVRTRKEISPQTSKVFDVLPKILIALFILGAVVLVWYFVQQNASEDSQGTAPGGNEVSYQESEELQNDPEEIEENTAEEENPEQDPIDEEPEPEPEPAEQELEQVEVNGRNTIFELRNADSFEVRVVSTGKTWVNILNGNSESFWQGELPQGETDSMTADFSDQSEATIIAGYPPDTEIYVNDQKLEFTASPSRQDFTIRYVQENE
ncbi:helix-turn-helix domain-containing protein [Mesobacillus harenae]|uniref:helix-turn-helix domain-containing protein n=1 Tax=Mesobacillus harenae TaxID=2213203 RepID=UPI0015800401|nr:RodZ domain-containing protein [Mesobacillus harenae]